MDFGVKVHVGSQTSLVFVILWAIFQSVDGVMSPSRVYSHATLDFLPDWLV